MKAHEIAARFSGAFADATPTGADNYTALTEQSSEEKTLPCVVFECKTRVMSGSSNALTFDLAAVVESVASPSSTVQDPPANHAAAVEAVRKWLFTTGKAALLTAINGNGFDFRGWSPVESDPDLEGNHFKTPVAASGIVLVV